MHRGLAWLLTVAGPEADQRRRGRAAVILSLGLLGLCIATIPLALSGPAPIRGLLSLSLGATVFIAAIFLARSGAVDLSALLIVIFPTLIILTNVVISDVIHVRPIYLVLSVLLAAILLRPWQIGLVGLGNAAGLLLAIALIPGNPLDGQFAPQILFGTLTLLGISTVVGMLGASTMAATLHERERADAALRASEERFQLVAALVRAVIYEHDLEANRVTRSASMANVLGYPTESAAPTVEWWVALIHPDDRERAAAAIAAARQSGESFSVEYRVRAYDGGYRYLLDRGLVVRAPDGRPVRVIGSTEDVSEQRALEARAAQAQKMESVGQIAGGMAHDFNNVLTVITGNVGLAIESLAPDDPARADLQVAAEAAERARSIIRQLLVFARRQPLEPRVIDLNELLTPLDRLLRPLIRASITLDVKRQPGLWPISADPGQLEQVIVNLVLNARDAMPRGGTLTIETANVALDAAYLRNHLDSAHVPQVLLAVSDTGVGMTPEVQARIFEPFFTTKELGVGSGLGLATCYGIVRQHGGDIWCESEPGSGTTFYICLPRAWARLADVPSGAELRSDEQRA